jgi:AcrR family transcriptional regulator
MGLQRPAVPTPISSLPKPAREILAAARRLLRDGGLSALTLQAIATEAGQHKASVGYYFGNKAGLLAVLMDAVTRDAELEFMDATKRIASPVERARVMVDDERKLAEDPESFRDGFEILPYALRDDELRQRLASVYDWYREANAAGLIGAHGDDEDLQSALPLAGLMTAVLDGLAIQESLEPGNPIVEASWQLWRQCLGRMVAEHPDEGGRGAG